MTSKGLHIGFCGIDGSGKSSQVRLLHRWMKENSRDVVLHEDTRNFISEVSTSIARRHGVDLGFEYLGEDRYIMAMSFEVLSQVMLKIRPYTDAGITVITSRTVFDYLARTKVRGCDNKTYEIVEEIMLFRGGPDITIWLDTPPKIAHQRIQSRGYDFSEMKFLENFRIAFSELSAKYNWVRIDGSGDVASIHRQICQTIPRENI